MQSDADARPPRELTPAFYGCYDWHSSVHGHWLLVRLVKQFPDAPFAAPARAALASSLTPANIQAEVDYLRGPGRASFERPYGLAWLLQLAAELRSWDDPQAAEWANALAPLEVESAQRFAAWLPKLHYPIRVGEHSQTAFAFGLLHDWAVVRGDVGIARLLDRSRTRLLPRRSQLSARLRAVGRGLPVAVPRRSRLHAQAADHRAVLKLAVRFLPGIPTNGRADWLAPGVVTDRSDPKLAHIDGLNLSRAWMLEGIASALPPNDRRRASLIAAARAHEQASLPAVTGEHYEGGHWLGTFAVYLTTKSGIAQHSTKY